VAEKNAEGLAASVDIVQSDLLLNYPYEADIIVANLPYVDPEWEHSPETKHEPELALFASNHGLSLMFRLLAEAPGHLGKGGHLLLEADPQQHDALIKQAKKHDFTAITSEGYALLLRKN
jgi:release factor glutamine methyltransferase